MIYKIQYSDQPERESVIAQNIDKTLLEEQNLCDGNFLIFTDTLPIDVHLSQIKEDNLILMDALATVYEEIQTLKEGA